MGWRQGWIRGRATGPRSYEAIYFYSLHLKSGLCLVSVCVFLSVFVCLSVCLYVCLAKKKKNSQALISESVALLGDTDLQVASRKSCVLGASTITGGLQYFGAFSRERCTNPVIETHPGTYLKRTIVSSWWWLVHPANVSYLKNLGLVTDLLCLSSGSIKNKFMWTLKFLTSTKTHCSILNQTILHIDNSHHAINECQ